MRSFPGADVTHTHARGRHNLQHVTIPRFFVIQPDGGEGSKRKEERNGLRARASTVAPRVPHFSQPHWQGLRARSTDVARRASPPPRAARAVEETGGKGREARMFVDIPDGTRVACANALSPRNDNCSEQSEERPDQVAGLLIASQHSAKMYRRH